MPSSPQKDQNHLLHYDHTEDDTDSSLASSLTSESDIEQPDTFMEGYTSTQGSLPSHAATSSTVDTKPSKTQGRSHRLSKVPEFRRLPVQGPSKTRSLLHQKLVQSGAKQNPDLFGQYASWGSTDGYHGVQVRLYLPGQVDPDTGKDIVPLSLLVRKEANMENLVGFGLLSFFRTYGRYPTHPDISPSSVSNMTTEAWHLRIVEDGCVDEDYPSTWYLH